MVNSVLLYLDEPTRSEQVIELGVDVARRQAARVRGVTLVDTRRIESLSSSCEAAVYAVMEQTRLNVAERARRTVRADLSRACLEAGLNFDVRQLSGDPLELLPRESQFHDLAIAAHPRTAGSKDDDQLSAGQLVELVLRGVEPLLVVRQPPRTVQRVLMVHHGVPSSARAIKSFLAQNLFPQAEHRLMAVGSSEQQARQHLREMADYCLPRRRELELGCLCGSLRRVLLPYAQKWQADLLVLGIARTNRMLARLMGNVARDVLTQTSSAIYTCG